MDTIIIRQAKVGDEKSIAQIIKIGLNRKNWLYTGTDKYSPKKLERIKETLSNHSAARIFVAEDKKNIIGSITYSFKKSGRTSHRVDLGWGLHPDYQGRGIGTGLLKFALNDATKRGFKRAEAEMAIKNKASWKMALKCGFKIEGIKKKALLLDDGKYIDTYIVGKIL